MSYTPIVYSAAIRKLDNTFDADWLEKLLTSNNQSEVIDGFFILSELTNYPSEFLTIALQAINHENWQVRSYLANSLLIRVKELSDEQIRESLKLSMDFSRQVFHKAIEILARIEINRLSDIEFPISKYKKLYASYFNGLNEVIKKEEDLCAPEKGKRLLECLNASETLRNALDGKDVSIDSTLPETTLEYLKWRLAQIAQQSTW